MICPCNSGETYNNCCAVYHNNNERVEQAEQLMRSRYSAYALEDYNYVLQTYGALQQKNLTLEELAQSAEQQKWVKLFIHQVDENTIPATVEYSAYYLIENTLYELREHSRFLSENGGLKYIDGDILFHDKRKTISRNDQCPCNSGKKFKKCCSQ